jgi:hypothetical protein
MADRAKVAKQRVLVIACGALAREIMAVKTANKWRHLDVTCLPASLHNRPKEIPNAVRRRIRAARSRYEQIYCLYADCGTGGELDAMLAEEGVERIEGAHCYAFYGGLEQFDRWMEEEPGTFFLTDYLVRHFERLVWKGLGLDRFPQLRDDYFRNYRRMIYLAQTEDPALQRKAADAAQRLGLRLETRITGMGGLAPFLDRAANA